MPPHATRKATLPGFPTSKLTTPKVTCSSSPTISAVIPASRRAPGWKGIHASITSSFPPGRAGSTCKRAGGGSSAVMPWLARALPIPRRSSKLPASQPLNSTCEPSPGCGDDRLRRLVTVGVSSVTAFKEWSTSDAFHLPSQSPKPLWVSFLLKNGTHVRLNVAEGVTNQEELETFISYLKL